MIILIFILVLALTSCFNPFFPQTGTPHQVASSPERTIQLLKEAYERKDIYSFEDLIYSQNEFSSYTQISNDYSRNLNIFFGRPSIFIDSIFVANRFLPQNRGYFELKWVEEYNIHRKMFEQSDEIVFLVPFYAADYDYTVYGNDTVSVLVKTHPSRMRIKYGGNDETFDVTGQIFAMKKDDIGIWKIWKWIELN